MSEKKVCKNCGRPKPILGRGLCGGCYYAAKKYPAGSTEYLNALARAKERFTDPNYKAYARTDHKKTTTPKTIKPETQKRPKPQPQNLSEITVLDMLIAERNMYQEKISKINQAIEILQ